MSAMWVGERGKRSVSVGQDTKKRIMDGANVRDRAKGEKRTVRIVTIRWLLLMIRNYWSTLFIFIHIPTILMPRVWVVRLFLRECGHRSMTVPICILICVPPVSFI